MIKVCLTDLINTDYSGYKKLVSFYMTCSQYYDECIYIDFLDLTWIDANLSALFDAIIHKLKNENRLSFASKIEHIEKKFNVLLRNGFIQNGKTYADDQQTTLPSTLFQLDDKSGFVDYIESYLMKHRGMPKSLSASLKEQITDDLIEIFCNSHHHAETKEPFFVSGQYYPTLGYLRFTMVDLGNGFLPRIHKATNGEIKTSLNAITWALKGNSSKLVLDKTSGGLGLSSILKYCKEHNGQLDVISGDGYWSSSYESNIFQGGRVLGEQSFVGTTINLSFKN